MLHLVHLLLPVVAVQLLHLLQVVVLVALPQLHLLQVVVLVALQLLHLLQVVVLVAVQLLVQLLHEDVVVAVQLLHVVVVGRCRAAVCGCAATMSGCCARRVLSWAISVSITRWNSLCRCNNHTSAHLCQTSRQDGLQKL